MKKKSTSYHFHKLLVALDGSELDSVLIRTVAHVSKQFPVAKIHFLTVAKELDLPQGVKDEFPDLADAATTQAERIREQLDQNGNLEPNIQVEVEVLEGDPTDKLLRFIKTNHIDLLLVGRKTNLKGSGTIPNKLVKVAPCSVLFVPESMPSTFKRILVPLDFSEHARFALTQAVTLSEKEGEVLCQNVVAVPTGYHKSGKTREEFGIILQGHAEKEYEHFIKTFDAQGIALKSVFETNDDNNPADEIYDRAVNEKVDLIVLGSKGRKGLSSVLLGSVASRVLEFSKTIPVMVVKGKGEGLNFLQALLRL